MTTITREITHFHLFCGLGGGAKGFNQGEARVGNIEAKFTCLGGIDVDPASIKDFGRLAGVPGTVMDLFSREQYIAFHGNLPPAGWKEATPDDIRRAAQGRNPNIVFLSAPCKGFSGLLSETLSKTNKYQALNELTLRGVWLTLEAFKDDPVELFVFENVPRIATRGRPLLDQITKLFHRYDYFLAETTHDCGELGGLSQSRKRFLLVARHAKKVPNFLYEPEKKTLKPVSAILGRMPVPGNGVGGPMHRVPSLQFKTWVRLAFVKAGSDWRSLNELRIVDGKLADYLIVPDNRNNGFLGVNPWNEPMGTVAGRSMAHNGNFSIADPRMELNAKWTDGQAYGVRKWNEPTGTVTSKNIPGQGPYSVADPRVGNDRSGPYGVTPWDKNARTVAGESFPTNGDYSVADPRMNPETEAERHKNVFRVVRMDEAAGTISGGHGPSSGGQCVADPRHHGPAKHSNEFRIVKFDEAAGAVTGAHGTGQCVADPRDGLSNDSGKYKITPWQEPSGCIIGGHDHGAYGVADPRPDWKNRYGNLNVADWNHPSKTVIAGGKGVQGGWLSVADPRALHRGKGDDYLTGGHYGVLPWDRHALAVSGSACHDNGWNSVADPRMPEATDNLVCVIRALDGTWHRPFTTLELAALQSLLEPDEHFELEGLSDSAWRERIGNAVPSNAAKAIAGVMGTTLLLAQSGQTFMLSSMPIWVRNIAIALSVRQPDLPL